MIHFFPCVLALLLMATPAAAAPFDALENVSKHYATAQPDLKTYQAQVQTSKLEEMILEMTANMPADMPRPQTPQLVKYWSQDTGRAVIRMADEQPFPYMEQMVKRFSAQFNIDLKSFLLPSSARGQRESLLKKAAIKTFESKVEDSLNLHIDIVFDTPTDLDEAFFRRGLNIPDRGILQLAFDIDPEENIVRRMALTDGERHYLVEIRHKRSDFGHLLEEINLTTPDGNVDDRFVTTFKEIDGFLLPSTQVRTLHHGQSQETISVTFSDYRLNITLPESVLMELNQDH